jgi:CSLREA domain-containing protein
MNTKLSDPSRVLRALLFSVLLIFFGVTVAPVKALSVSSAEAQVVVGVQSTMTVTSTADTQADDGQCTLREAILNANSNDQSGSVDCAAGSTDADTIQFSLTYPNTITLTSKLPNISGKLSIEAPGADSLAINGGGSVSILFVSYGASLELSGATLRNGFSSAVGNYGKLSVANCAILNSVNIGTGGGIDNSGTLTVTGSTFSGNGAFRGGGILNAGTATVTNSTFADNSSNQGGGINNSGTLTVTNSTFSGNSASTGGSIYTSAGTVTLRNTLLASSGNNCSGTVTASTDNQATDATCGSATVKTLVELNLGTLQDNGGDTPTVALLIGSSAIDAGNDSYCPATDQRGVARPLGEHCDVGAYELYLSHVFLPLVVRE